LLRKRKAREYDRGGGEEGMGEELRRKERRFEKAMKIKKTLASVTLF
jgi:hypothetical protein